ncbi:unnamed protein product [Cochlearia groenlandica]
MVTGSRVGGSVSIGIDDETKKTISYIKEIVGNHSDSDVFAVLKEVNMDADEAVHKLMYQDPFHEVKRRKDKKKEETVSVEPAEMIKPSENISREVSTRTQPERNVRRRDYNQNNIPRNAAPRNSVPKNPAAGPSREFRVVRDNRSNLNADKEFKHTSTQSSGSNIREKVAIHNQKGSSVGSVDHQPYGDRNVAHRKPRQTGNVHQRRPTRKELYEGRQRAQDVTVPESNSILGVYSSMADPVHVPSPENRSSAVGAIRREVRGLGSGRKPFENVSKDSSAAGSLVEPANRKDVPKAYRPCSPTSKVDQGIQVNARKSVNPNHRSISNNRHGNRSYQYARTQQQAGGHQKGVSQNKQWKPKSNQKSIGNNLGVIGTPKPSRAPTADNSKNMETETVKLQDNLSHVSISESQNVIIADYIRVPETDRCQLTFGSFVPEFDPSVNSASGFEEAYSSQELKQSDIDNSLDTPNEAAANVASGTKIVETFDSEAINSGAGSPPPELTASDQQLSEQKEAPISQNLDGYGKIEFISGNGSPYPALEPKQQQDPLELHKFSEYDPRGGYDLQYFRQAMEENMRGQGIPSPHEQTINPHMFSSTPATSIPMMQQQQGPVSQMYPQVHVSHYPNGMPFRQFISPVYVPQMPMQGYSGNPGAYAHPSNGNSYMMMPGGSSHPGGNGVKYGIQQFKPVPTGGPAGFGTFNNPNGYQISNAPGYEDSSRMKYKDGNVYVPNPQTETSEIWMQNTRELTGLQSQPFYNVAGQTPHGAYMSSFNSPPVQSSHVQFQGVFHPQQPGPIANPHHMGPGLGGNVGIGVAPSPSPVQVGGYQQQPQLGHLNWPANF